MAPAGLAVLLGFAGWVGGNFFEHWVMRTVVQALCWVPAFALAVAAVFLRATCPACGGLLSLYGHLYPLAEVCPHCGVRFEA